MHKRILLASLLIVTGPVLYFCFPFRGPYDCHGDILYFGISIIGLLMLLL